jgi:hypothetical protein
MLKRLEMSFWEVQKSAEECEKTGDSGEHVHPLLRLWARKSAEECEEKGDE